MPQPLLPDFWSDLFGEHDRSTGWLLEDIKNAIARDLEDLLNTRRAVPDAILAGFPHTQVSILAYGLPDFSALCVSNDVSSIGVAVALAISRHEPRLADVRARMIPEASAINRISFQIHARLQADAGGPHVCFDGMLEPSGQRCTIRRRMT